MATQKKATSAKAKTTKSTKSNARGSSANVASPFRNFTPYQPKKKEIYMSEGQLDHFRALLKNWRHELMEEVDRTVHHMQDEAANFPDPADRANPRRRIQHRVTHPRPRAQVDPKKSTKRSNAWNKKIMDTVTPAV